MNRFSFPIWEEVGVPRPTPEQVRNYVLAHEWREQPYGPELFVFEGPKDDDDRTIVQVLPSSDSYTEYPQRLLELLRALSLIEHRLIRHILADMLAPESNGAPVQATTTADGETKKARRPRKGRQA
jgi:hypothetical protein